MKKLVLLISMTLAIAGVYAQGVDFTVNKKLKKDYFKVQISITSGVAPFDITFNGRHVDQYSLFAQYGVNNIITITDANSTSKTDTIYEADPDFHWSISHYEDEFELPIDPDNPEGNFIYHSFGVSIGCSFDDRYNFNARCYDTLHREIGFTMEYWGSNDSVNIYLCYPINQIPVGLYCFTISDTVHGPGMDTTVFFTITNPL